METNQKTKPITHEVTFGMVKPSAAKPSNLPLICEAIKNAGLTIEAIAPYKFTKEKAQEFYKEHEGKDFFSKLVDMLVSGEVVCMKLSGEDAVTKWRTLIGPTNPAKGESWQLRKRFADAEAYANGSPDNGFHGSDSPKSAQRELGFIFDGVFGA